jgi:outer membrane biosynthesis protein TonB
MTRNRWTWPLVTMLVLSPLAIGSGMAAAEAFPIGTREASERIRSDAPERVTSLETDPTEEPTMSATPPDVQPTVTKVPTRGSAGRPVSTTVDAPDPTPEPTPEPTGEPKPEPEATPEPVHTKAPDRAGRGDDGVWWCYPADGSDPYPCT